MEKKHKFNVGDKVYIQERYPPDELRPCVERKVVGLLLNYESITHDAYIDGTPSPTYILDKVVKVGKNYTVGNFPAFAELWEEEQEGDLVEPIEEFYIHELGEKLWFVPVDSTKKVLDTTLVNYER
jgi:hypothetical protein